MESVSVTGEGDKTEQEGRVEGESRKRRGLDGGDMGEASKAYQMLRT